MHVQEARRSAAMLDVGLPRGVGGREKERIARGDERGELRRDRVLEAAAPLHVLVRAARPAARLDLAHRGREDNILVGVHAAQYCPNGCA